MIPFLDFQVADKKNIAYIACVFHHKKTSFKNCNCLDQLKSVASNSHSLYFSVSLFCSVKEIFPYKEWSGVVIQPSFMLPRVGGNVSQGC